MLKKIQEKMRHSILENTKLLLTLFAAPLFISTAQGASVNKTPEDVKPYRAHVAFAGGGWRAHSGHAGWTLSLLESSGNKLEDAFANVGTISSNSGGSWFSTMLIYSDSFVQAIEAKDAIRDWSIASDKATGWLGQQEYLFGEAPCHELRGSLFALCVAGHYSGGPLDGTYWHKVAEDVVFHNHKITETLAGVRQPWAKGKPLLLAASLLTSESVIGRDGLDEQYYQACMEPSKPMLKGRGGASCLDEKGRAAYVTPVTFASMPKGSNLKTPAFLSARGKDGGSAQFNLGYSEHALIEPDQAHARIELPVVTDHLPVITAASASSAAAGFGASRSVTKSWVESYLASDQALNFQLAGGLKHILAEGMGVKELAAKKVVQIADGGTVDNSAVAQLIGFLQQNGQADGFNIVAFDNVQEVYTPPGNAAKVGIDIATLFGKGLWNDSQLCSDPKGKGSCVTVPPLKIFEHSPLSTTSELWSAAASTHNPPKVLNELIYTKYQVTTVDNPTFGIKAGSSGTLHAFTAAWSNASTVPQNTARNKDFEAYASMLEFIISGLQKNNTQGRNGVQYLKAALGIATQ